MSITTTHHGKQKTSGGWDIRSIIVTIAIVMRVVIAMGVVILVIGVTMALVAPMAVTVIVVVRWVTRHDDRQSLLS